MINDVNFTRAYIADKVNLSNVGLDKIRSELLNHNIPNDLIDSELAKIDNSLIEEKLKKLINKKVKNSKYTGYKLKFKVVNELINLGYDKSQILELYDNISVDNTENIKNEYNKLYKKLSVKYKDKELERRIKTKLYNRGFSIDEINKVMEN